MGKRSEIGMFWNLTWCETDDGLSPLDSMPPLLLVPKHMVRLSFFFFLIFFFWHCHPLLIDRAFISLLLHDARWDYTPAHNYHC
jgi:hypothetical protein